MEWIEDLKKWVTGLFAKAKQETDQAIAAAKREVKIELYGELEEVFAARRQELQREKDKQ